MKNLFGTDGIRAIMGNYPLTHEGLHTLGKILGSWAYAHSKPKMIIATDTRNSSCLCKHTILSGLVHVPITVHDAGILPTPVLHYLVQNYDYDYGIVITASHNSAEYNGVKIVTKTGKLSPLEQESLAAHADDLSLTSSYTTLGQTFYKQDAFELYQDALQKNFPADFLKNSKIVIDCANGAWSYYAESIFKNFGAHVISIASSGPTNAINKECGSLHPSYLQKAVLEHQATIGFAFDGDGDRVIAVTAQGEIKNGDDILSLLLHHPIYKKNNTIIGTVMTNEGLAEYVYQQNKNLLRTQVGDCHILKILQEQQASLGGEPSGHIITRDFSETSDGLFVALRVIETMILTDNMEFKTFVKYPQEIRNIPVTLKKEIDTADFQELVSQQSKYIEKSRIMIRYSGTEPVVRILVEYNKEEDKEVVLTKILPSLTHYFV